MAHVPERTEDMSSYLEGQTHQLMDALENAGYTPAHVTALGQNSNGILDQLMLVLTGHAKIVTDFVFRLVVKIDRNMKGWTCVKTVDVKDGELFKPTFLNFVYPRETQVSGEEMIRRVGNIEDWTGLCHAEAMLRNQERIPAEQREHRLVFPEVWQGPNGYRHVFCLYWDGKRWYLYYYWLDDAFGSDCRLVCSRK